MVQTDVQPLSYQHSEEQMHKILWKTAYLMRKYLWTNNRITSILCHSWWRWCLFYFRTKIIVDTNAKYFPHQSWRVYIWRRQIYSTLDFFWVFLEKKFFFSKIWVAKLGAQHISEWSLSASLSSIWIFWSCKSFFFWSLFINTCQHCPPQRAFANYCWWCTFKKYTLSYKK